MDCSTRCQSILNRYKPCTHLKYSRTQSIFNGFARARAHFTLLSMSLWTVRAIVVVVFVAVEIDLLIAVIESLKQTKPQSFKKLPTKDWWSQDKLVFAIFIFVHSPRDIGRRALTCSIPIQTKKKATEKSEQNNQVNELKPLQKMTLKLVIKRVILLSTTR